MKIAEGGRNEPTLPRGYTLAHFFLFHWTNMSASFWSISKIKIKKFSTLFLTIPPSTHKHHSILILHCGHTLPHNPFHLFFNITGRLSETVIWNWGLQGITVFSLCSFQAPLTLFREGGSSSGTRHVCNLTCIFLDMTAFLESKGPHSKNK